MKCIYCLQTNKYFSKAEHIIPQSFGLFKQNFTLHNYVCDECNQRFGDEFELRLARDTLDGLYRTYFNHIPRNRFKHLGINSSLRMNFRNGEFADAKCYIFYSDKKKDIVVHPLKQIGLYSTETNMYKYFLYEEINGIDLSKYDYIKHKIKYLALSDSEICETNNSLGIQVDKGEICTYKTPDAFDINVIERFDNQYKRSIAKIAFNFFTYLYPELIYHSCFDIMRDYIYKNTNYEYCSSVIIKSDTNALSDEKDDFVRLGHVLILNKSTKYNFIKIDLSFYNIFHYEIILSENCEDIIKGIEPKGFFFNIHKNEIIELKKGDCA